MCDIDMSSDSNFDTDANSDFDVDTSSDFETIDSFDDIDATLTEDIDSFNADNTIDSFAELDVLDGIDDTSEFDNIGDVDDIIENFSALDDVESLELEEVSESVDSIKDEDIEVLDFDDSDTKNLDSPSNLLNESDFSLEQLEGILNNLDIPSSEESIIENMDEIDLNDLDELNFEENENSLFENELDAQDQLSNTDLESVSESSDSAENIEEMVPEESNVSLDDLHELIDSSNDIDRLREIRNALTTGDTMVISDDAGDINDINESEHLTEEPEMSQLEMSVEELESSENAVVEEMDRPEHVAINELAEMFDGEENIDDWRTVRDSISSGNLIVDSPEMIDDSPKTLTRDISPELQESIAENTENILDNYRENLELHNVSEENIEDYINQARENLDAEFNSAINNTPSENIHYQPNDWNEVAESLNTQQEFVNEQSEIPTLTTEIEQQLEQNNNDIQEMNINYDEIYDEIQRGSIEQGFENIHIDEDPERLNSSLESFSEDTWQNFSLDEQKSAMHELADYVVDIVGFDNPPKIEYYYNEKEGDFGGYNSQTNTLSVNEYMLYNSNEAADTIAHELWHAHQYECAMNPQSALDYQYQYNFENYIDPSLGQKEYESQLVEAEARAFASQFKDRIKHILRR